MHIDFCLISSDLNEKYVGLYPYVRKAWNKIGIKTKLVLISENIPSFLNDYSDEIILFSPLENMHTAYQSQCIRLLYPCIFEDKNILISDMDIIPLSKKYFFDSIEHISNDKFVIYRDSYIKDNMYAMCYNIANSSVWKNIFSINTLDDIKKTLRLWYNEKYDGIKNCDGWFTDQQMLYKYINNYDKNNIIILNDSKLQFNRLDKRKKTYIVTHVNDVYNDIKNKCYTDFHVIRPYYKYISLINNVINLIDI